MTIDPQTHRLVRHGVKAMLNPSDRYTLEKALRFRDQHGGRLTVISMGAPQSADVLVSDHLVGADSADKITCRKTLHGNPYVKSILVQCAWAAVKTRNSEFQKWFWPRQCRLGRKKAIIAVARKLLCLLYTLLSKGVLYSPPSPEPIAV